MRSHLDSLNLRLSNERLRLAKAKSPTEIDARKVWIAQMEKEIASELKFLIRQNEISNMTDDELLAALKE
jgi:hypothetical protein